MESQRRGSTPRSLIGPRQHGFTLIELAIATVVLLVGVVAVVQLVPAAVQLNMYNRRDSTAIVIAQRELDQMMSQPLTAVQFTDADGRIIQLGNAGAPNAVVGGPVQMVGNAVGINFNGPAVPGYNFVYTDPNSAPQVNYEVRWAVVTTVNGLTVVSKRFIVGAWKRDARQLIPPVTVETWVQR